MAIGKISSVYKIVNLKTNKVYVGSAVDELNINYSSISKNLRGKLHKTNNNIFKYG